ncbi:hypothetical protein [Sphingomonas sp. BAUL-RG-20F-R05-02]|uniref:hypothetical protein n=1 Tax=Sphingomonas sp. BAUL-RG-20F-R05-02 TaxID=2914830 RepID=UPI001F5AD95A|nr:hypothetical protein [Sphingomonas sp. BAUL-RG-20F-R05-02]
MIEVRSGSGRHCEVGRTVVYSRGNLFASLNELEHTLATLRRRTLIVGSSAVAITTVRLVMILAARP